VAEEDEEAGSSEDEVSKQKKRIKALAAVRSVTGQDPASAGKKSTRSAKKAKIEPNGSANAATVVSDGLVTSDEEDEAEDDESEDEVTKQKKRIKALANGNDKGKGKGKAAAKKNDRDEFYDPVIEAIIHKAEKAAKKVAQPSLLHEMSWFRIILDEAHCIKDRSTSTAKAVFELTSVNKWCLTGTPLQNRVGELYSLVRFLRLDPHAYYFCRTKGCECKSLHYRFGPNHKECEECGHTPMNHFAHFNRHILNPIKRCGYITEGKHAMLQLKREILDKILLRRTKTTRSDDILLPPRLVRLRADRLDEREEDFYQALYTQSQAQFNTYIQAGTVLHNYAHIFDILIRLRQAVDHPYLVMHSSTRAGEIDQGLVEDFGRQRTGDTNDVEGNCELCREMAEDPVVAACSHVFCSLCVEEYIQSAGEGLAADCPQCSRPLTIDLSNQHQASQSGISSNPGISVWDSSKRRRQSIIHRVDLANFQSSTKLEALLEVRGCCRS
jgi:DNA repair protein RAD16